MASIGKRILSAFVEMSGEEKSPPVKPTEPVPEYSATEQSYKPAQASSAKFTQYFEKLFRDANLPGPDYFEFSKMIEIMSSSMPDERARYTAAFAGLSVQGLDKSKLLATAVEYLRILKTDADNFGSSVDAALQEKVHAKQKGISDKTARVQQLEKEIQQLQQQINMLQGEIRENEEKIENNSGAYRIESVNMITRIENDIEKIKQHIH